VITPNNQEAEDATHSRIRTDEDARLAAALFGRRSGAEAVLVTRGEHGMWLSSPTGEGAVRAIAREVSDVTGAGDTVVATLALALAAGATLQEAAVVANHAAGIVVGNSGRRRSRQTSFSRRSPTRIRNSESWISLALRQTWDAGLSPRTP